MGSYYDDLSIAEQRRAQLDELFRGYEHNEPIRIKGVKNGARVVVLSDMQIPFEDRRLVGSTTGRRGIVEEFIADYQPDYIFLNGDILDCYTISDFSKNPNRRFTISDELKLAGRMLDGLRAAAPKARIIWIDGNHEYRMWRTYADICQRDARAGELLEALDIHSISTRRLLHLDDRGIAWQPYSGFVDFLGFVITHGNVVSQFSSYTARKMMDKWHSSGTNGHTHRLGSYFRTDASGDSHVWYESGCLCRLDPEYVAGPNWQSGFLYGEVLRDKVHMQMATIFDGSLVISGIGTYGDKKKARR